jgi:tRNA pseudouridine38-40 synthase
VVAFELDWPHPPDDLQAALNANLPKDMAVAAVDLAEPGFHPRYDARARRYQYRIYCRSARDPLRDRFTWRVWPEVWLPELNEAARSLVGEHDFAAFGAPMRKNGSTIRHVYQAAWTDRDGEMVFDIIGNAFLYRMVRRLVFAQVVVCQHLLEIDEMLGKLHHPGGGMIQGIAPACGLELVEVIY